MRLLQTIRTKYMNISLEISTMDVQTHSILSDFPDVAQDLAEGIRKYSQEYVKALEVSIEKHLKPEIKSND